MSTVKHDDRHVYGEVENEADLARIFDEIRQDVRAADSRPTLTELHKRAGYLITLTYAPSWEEKFGHKAEKLRMAARDEFRRTAKIINRRAEQIGAEPNYDESWGEK